MGKTIDITGERFGRLIVLSIDKPKNRQSMFKCLCDCGNEKVISGHSLRIGKTKSFGCLYKETRADIAHKSIAKIKHGSSYDRLYYVWNDMKSRCNNVNDISYHNYGGRGISYCDDWNDFSNFKNWAISSGYDENAVRGECTLDRIDVNKNYSPENCRWENMRHQSNNRRNTPFLTYKGETKSLSDWANELNIDRGLLYSRYKSGWNADRIFSEPKRSKK